MTEQRQRRGAIGVIVREDGRMLVIERSQFVRAPGKLCFPGGEIEPGESEPEAVTRELLEELNLRVNPLRRIWRNATPTGVELSWWLTEIVGDQTPLPNWKEVASFAWMSRSEMASHPEMLYTNQEFLCASLEPLSQLFKND